jgi:hypothetical protein
MDKRKVLIGEVFVPDKQHLHPVDSSGPELVPGMRDHP